MKTETVSLLQPIDSARVADCIIAKIEWADISIARAIRDSLDPTIQDSLGRDIAMIVKREVSRSVESILGSKDFADVVSAAIETGIAHQK
jgi:hypothetical protein